MIAGTASCLLSAIECCIDLPKIVQCVSIVTQFVRHSVYSPFSSKLIMAKLYRGPSQHVDKEKLPCRMLEV